MNESTRDVVRALRAVVSSWKPERGDHADLRLVVEQVAEYLDAPEAVNEYEAVVVMRNGVRDLECAFSQAEIDAFY